MIAVFVVDSVVRSVVVGNVNDFMLVTNIEHPSRKPWDSFKLLLRTDDHRTRDRHALKVRTLMTTER